MARQAERFVGGLADAQSRSIRDLAGDLIVLLLPTGTCSADRVAEHLGCERRTLHRRLAAEGTSYRALLEARRRELVLSLVASPRPLAEVADVGGFASVSGLSHWFQRCFATAPSAYRAGRSALRQQRTSRRRQKADLQLPCPIGPPFDPLRT
ncbi:MAG: helix-turn-helix domain-containing protein, partial [Phenylobacterium sp.]